MERSKSITIIFLLAVGLLASVAPAKTTSVLLQEGLYAEEIEGDLDAAIKIYEQVIVEAKKAQRAAAQATYRIGMCFLKKGEKTKAAEYFQQIVSNYQSAKSLVERATQQLQKISPQNSEYLPWEVMVYIYDKHMDAHKKAKSKGIAVNSHVVGVDEEFKKYPGGILTHETSKKVAAGREIWLGNFGQAGEVDFFNEELQPQEIRFSKRETNAIGKYMLLWKADRNMEAGEVRVIAYRSKTTEKLIATDNGYQLGFNNHYGSPVLENFFLVVPLDVSIVEQSREYATRKTFDMCEIYHWQKEVPANTTNKVDVVLARTKTVSVGSFGPVMERVINDNGEEKHWLIDFETGRLFSPSTETRSDEAFSRWIAENRIDAMGETRTSSPGLYGFDMEAIPIAAETWETISPKGLADALSIAKSGIRTVMSAKGKLPVTYTFKTREGGMGVVQILEMQYKKKPRYFRIRYKMLRPAAMKETVKLNVGKPAYEWWTSEPSVTKTMYEGSELEICWETDPKTLERILGFAVGIMPLETDLTDLDGHMWFVQNLAFTVRRTPYGKRWRSVGSTMDPKRLQSGQYRVYVCAFDSKESRVWRDMLKIHLVGAATAKLIVKPVPEIQTAFLPDAETPDLEDLIKRLHRADTPRFVALNKIIEIGEPAVERLIAEMEKSNNWQVPKALGAIKDKRAVGPLIQKWQKCDWSPMKEVIAEALERITGKKLGQDKQKWDKWWLETKRFISPEATLRNFMSAAMKLGMNNAMEYVASDSHDYKDIQEIFEESEHPFNMLFRKIDPSVPVKILETKIIDNMCEAVWQVTFKEDFAIEGKTFKAGETFDIDGNLHRYGDKWLITGI